MGIGLDGRGRRQSRALQRETERLWVERDRDTRAESARQHTLPRPLGTDHMPDLYLQRKQKQLPPQALWYKGP